MKSRTPEQVPWPVDGSGRLLRPLQLAHVGAFPFPTGQGSQVFVRGMCAALAARGHSVGVACYAHGESGDVGGLRVHRTPPIPGYRRTRAGPDWVKPGLDVMLSARVAALASSCDLVHGHNYEGLVCALAGARPLGVPVAYSAHNLMAEELPTYFSGTARRVLAGVVGRAMDQYLPRQADLVHLLSDRSLDVFHSLGCARVRVVPPGVASEDLVLGTPAVLPDGDWIVYAGNPDGYQELHLLAEAMAYLPEVGLLLVGGDPFPSELLASASRVKVVQTRDFSVVKSWIAAAQVGVIPRSQCSGFPIKLLNLLGLGVPTVVSEGSSVSQPGAIVVPDRNPRAMAAKIRSLLGNRPHLCELGAQARDYVLTRCTWAARAAELEQIYVQLLADRSPRRWRAGRPPNHRV